MYLKPTGKGSYSVIGDVKRLTSGSSPPRKAKKGGIGLDRLPM